jgi:DNA-directed RNA polymerase specialized sigma24 family protein
MPIRSAGRLLQWGLPRRRDGAARRTKGAGSMPIDESEGTVTRWIDDLREGGDPAAHRLWDRYFDRLIRLARSRLRAASRAVEDEEDVALSAFKSFVVGAQRGRYPDLADRDELWRLLVVITVRKAVDLHQRQRSARRGGGRAHEAGDDLDKVLGDDPTPEMLVLIDDQYRRLHAALGDDALRRVLDLRLQGLDRDEIAAQMGCSVRSVTRKLAVIRDAWSKEGAADGP